MSSSSSDWRGFFISAGIPAGIASRYAKSFEENRITRTMLPELDKLTLVDLGITAIGDQLAILRRIKQSGRSLTVDSADTMKVRTRITGPVGGVPVAGSTTVIPTASEARKGRPPPDSHEIYHVRMPTGATEKTRKILRKAEVLRGAGFLKRALSGVRQGGRPVSPVSKDPAARRLAMHNRLMTQQEEVSSSSDSLVEQLGVRGMYSDRIQVNRVLTGKVHKKTTPTSGSLFTRAIDSVSNTPEPKMRVRLPAAAQKINVTAKMLPRVTVNLGSPKISALPSSSNMRHIGVSRNRKIVTTQASSRTRNSPSVQVLYEDEEEMDQYEDAEEDIEEDDYADEEEDEIFEEEQRPSIFDRIRI